MDVPKITLLLDVFGFRVSSLADVEDSLGVWDPNVVFGSLGDKIPSFLVSRPLGASASSFSVATEV